MLKNWEHLPEIFETSSKKMGKKRSWVLLKIQIKFSRAEKFKKILIAPLDWGLGHFTRCIPLIQKLIEKGHIVITCGNKNAGIIFKEHFPEIQHHIIKGYEVRYSKTKS